LGRGGSGAELDLLLFLDGARYGIELKYADAPGITKSMRVALDDPGLRQLFVITRTKSNCGDPSLRSG
jgi:hypothetical protein